MNDLLKIFLELQERKVKDEEKKNYFFDINKLIWWFDGEVKEAKDEIKRNNSVYLEDELGDIFWTYMRLLYSLEKEWYIDAKRVFERCETKFRQRVEAVENDISWDDIKTLQKETLEKEHKKRYLK